MTAESEFYKTDHGIDLSAPGGLEALLSLHRSIFGGFRMEDDEDETGGDQGGSETGGTGTETPETPEQQQIARLTEDLRKARAEAGKDRTTAKATAATEAREAVLADIAKALGLGEDGTPTVEALTAEATEARNIAQSAAVELAVFRAAGKAGLDAEALLDSRTFAQSLAGLDPAAADFATKVTAAIKATGDRYKVKSPAGASGIPAGSGSGESRSTAKARPGLDRMRAAYAESGAQ